MKVDVQPGTYVVAVSGGVDSMALLDILAQKEDIKLIVAHLDHGIRHDSRLDRQLVAHAAKRYGLPFVYHEAALGTNASEALAREVRYEFLHKIKNVSGAHAIITAHHKDDALETAVLNLMRGTGRKGVSALYANSTIVRPLLHVSKKAIKDYALDQGLVWREDSTNKDNKYLRNYVRNTVLAGASVEHKAALHDSITQFKQLNQQIDSALADLLHIQLSGDTLDRRQFVRLPHVVARELMAAWLRKHDERDFDAKTLERLVVGSKTHQAGKLMDVSKNLKIKVGKEHLALEHVVR